MTKHENIVYWCCHVEKINYNLQLNLRRQKFVWFLKVNQCQVHYLFLTWKVIRFLYHWIGFKSRVSAIFPLFYLLWLYFIRIDLKTKLIIFKDYFLELSQLLPPKISKPRHHKTCNRKSCLAHFLS